MCFLSYIKLYVLDVILEIRTSVIFWGNSNHNQTLILFNNEIYYTHYFIKSQLFLLQFNDIEESGNTQHCKFTDFLFTFRFLLSQVVDRFILQKKMLYDESKETKGISM